MPSGHRQCERFVAAEGRFTIREQRSDMQPQEEISYSCTLLGIQLIEQVTDKGDNRGPCSECRKRQKRMKHTAVSPTRFRTSGRFFRCQHVGKDSHHEMSDQEFTECGMEELVGAKLAIVVGRPRLMNEEKSAYGELRFSQLRWRRSRPGYVWFLVNKQR